MYASSEVSPGRNHKATDARTGVQGLQKNISAAAALYEHLYLSFSVYIYIYIYMYVYVCVCVYIYIYIDACLAQRILLGPHGIPCTIHKHIHHHTSLSLSPYLSIYLSLSLYIYIYTYIYIHTFMHIDIQYRTMISPPHFETVDVLRLLCDGIVIVDVIDCQLMLQLSSI